MFNATGLLGSASTAMSQVWELPDLPSHLRHNEPFAISSEHFLLPDRSRWGIVICNISNEENSPTTSEHLQVLLKLFCFTRKARIVSGKCALKVRDQGSAKPLVVKDYALTFQGPSGAFWWDAEFCSRELLLKQNFKHFALEVSFFLGEGKKVSIKDLQTQMLYEAMIRKRGKIIADLTAVARTPHDVCFVVAEETFVGHSTVLSTASPVMKAMFEQTEMTEAVSGRVVIEDTTPEVFSAFLDYAYAGTLASAILKIHAKELLILADKYDAKQLKVLCVQELSKDPLDFGSAVELFVMADRIEGLDHLKTKVTSFLARNCSEFLASEQWKRLTAENASTALKLSQLVMSELSTGTAASASWIQQLKTSLGVIFSKILSRPFQ